MVKRNSGYDDLIITVGALILGWGLYNIITKTARSYAAEVYDCDKPYVVSQDDLDFASNLPEKGRVAYLKSKAKQFVRMCQDERKRRIGDETDGGALVDPTYPLTLSRRTKTYYPAVPEAVVRDNWSTYARAYAAAPCASACAPFKNSPGTYATCCKQHAATAASRPVTQPAAPKAPVRPAGFRTATVKSKLPKPMSTGALQQGQVKRVDDITSSNNLLTQKLRDLTNGSDNAPPPTSGGDCGTAKMECHNYGDRHEDKVDQTGASFEYGGTFLIPKATRHLTLEFGGLPHSGGNDRSGYKVEFNDGKPGVMLWKQVDTDYKPIKSAINGNTNYTAKIGSKINVVIRKQDIGPSSNPTGVEINAWADGELVGRWRDTVSSPLAGLGPYTGFVQGYRAGFRHDCLKGCCVKSCCTEGESGPSVICGPLHYTPLSNLSS